jgi:hypothetical protein
LPQPKKYLERLPALLPQPDPDGLLEYSVVYTDRALNHMSQRFQGVMKDISRILKKSTTPARRHRAGQRHLRHGSRGPPVRHRSEGAGHPQRLVQLPLDADFRHGPHPAESIVLKARQVGSGAQAPFAPAPIDEVVAAIRAAAAGRRLRTARRNGLRHDPARQLPEGGRRGVREVDGLFVLDCVASGTVWVDMAANNVDVLISAPQKGWSASPCCALIALGERARERIDATTSTSFACDLKKWLQIMEAFENGGHAYHATMPTDALAPCAT